MKRTTIPLMAALLAIRSAGAWPQTSSRTEEAGPGQLVETGQVNNGGHLISYVIRRLPVNSYPDLPDQVADVLLQRGCLIPQTFQAHRPENVVHASFERSGSSDWAVLCSTDGHVALLVFFASAPAKPIVMATAPETEYLQPHDSTGVMGFSWGIDPASPQAVHDAQIGLKPRPARLDHDALMDTFLEKGTTYHYYVKGKWTQLDMPEE